MVLHKSTVFYLPKLGQIVLIFPEALQHHCNKVMRCIFVAIYLATALLYYNDAPSPIFHRVRKCSKNYNKTLRRGNAFD